MSELRAHVALLVDWRSLHPASTKGGTKPSSRKRANGSDTEDAIPLPPATLARGLVAFAGQLGRIAFARAYSDFTKDPEAAREVAAARVEPILVPSTAEGCERADIRLVVDALSSLYAGDEPDAFVLVTADARMLPLVQAIRADGSEVYLVGPSAQVPADLQSEADRFVPLEEVVLGTAAVEPLKPRAFRSARSESPLEPGRGRQASWPASRLTEDAAPRRERQAHPTPVRSEDDFPTYDWGPFVRLIDELEGRLPFVGVRYLVNKVLGPHNCGVEDPRLKRELMNRAVDDGLIEMYPVGNVGDRADPVTACRLDRKNPAVVAVLGETTAPQPPAEEPHGVGVGDSEDLD